MAKKSQSERLATVKALLGISDTSEDTMLSAYLEFGKQAILNQMYSAVEMPEDVTDIPDKYESTLANAIVFAYNLRGAEGETAHNENGISRSYKYSDMNDYIKNNVSAIVKVGG